jgi:DNA-binding response OmpR family regulator
MTEQLCERCGTELTVGRDTLPAPWFDIGAHSISGKHIRPKVWQLLEVLWHHRARANPLSNDMLMRLIYENAIDDAPESHVIAVYLVALRKALRDTPFAIKTYWGAGWRLIDAPAT